MKQELLLAIVDQLLSLPLFIETWHHYAIQAGLELMILLPLPLKCLDYNCVPPCLALQSSFFDVFSKDFSGNSRQEVWGITERKRENL
jgi:hypothetical protein